MRRRGVAMAMLAAALALPLAGCGDDGDGDAASAPETSSSVPAPAQGTMPADGLVLTDAGITLAEARERPDGTATLVRAFVVDDGTGPRLCDGLTRSLPPLCGPGSAAIENLPPEFLDGAQEAAGTRWTAEPAQLIGALRDGVFVNDPLALAAS